MIARWRIDGAAWWCLLCWVPFLAGILGASIVGFGAAGWTLFALGFLGQAALFRYCTGGRCRYESPATGRAETPRRLRPERGRSARATPLASGRKGPSHTRRRDQESGLTRAARSV